MKKLTKVICLVAVCCCFCLVACGQKGSKGQPKNKSVAFTKDVAGIDVSHHQGKVNWEKVRKNASEGQFCLCEMHRGRDIYRPQVQNIGQRCQGERLSCWRLPFFSYEQQRARAIPTFQKNTRCYRPRFDSDGRCGIGR